MTSGASDGACWSERCELGVRSTSVEDRAGRATDAAAATAAAATADADHVKWRIAIEAAKAEAGDGLTICSWPAAARSAAAITAATSIRAAAPAAASYTIRRRQLARRAETRRSPCRLPLLLCDILGRIRSPVQLRQRCRSQRSFGLLHAALREAAACHQLQLSDGLEHEEQPRSLELTANVPLHHARRPRGLGKLASLGRARSSEAHEGLQPTYKPAHSNVVGPLRAPAYVRLERDESTARLLRLPLISACLPPRGRECEGWWRRAGYMRSARVA